MTASGFDASTMRVGTQIGSDLIQAECMLPGCGWRMMFSFGAQRLSTITEACEQHPCKAERPGGAAGVLKANWGVELTADRARQVRQWRIVPECTWREVAALADEAWGTEWDGNQLYGHDLCRASAQLLGENPDAEPWN
jgi:hypothetical protein